MKNVLIWGDNPHGITGFGKVVKNIIRQIYDKDKFKIDVLGISYLGDPYVADEYKGEKLMYDVWTPFEVGKVIDLYGTNKLMSMLSQGRIDILFILQDTFIVKNVMQKIVDLREKLSNKFVIIYYYPIDSHYVYPNWIKESVSLVDIPVAYTEFGKKMSIKHDKNLQEMDVIYHGTDRNIFKKFDPEVIPQMRKSFWGEDVADKFIVLNVNRNQPRKDLNRTFSVFKEFRKSVPRSFLFCLSNPADMGGNIIDMAAQHGLTWGTDWQSVDPAQYSPVFGIPEIQVATMYNLSDVCISTTLGEGWGFSLTEAMACGCPVIFPNNTSIREIIGKDEENPDGIRGSLVASGDMGNRICLGANDNNLSRPLTNVIDMANRLVQLAGSTSNPDSDFRHKSELAMKWVPSWEDVGVQWRDVFERAIVLHDIRGDSDAE